jgi:hypothetical protein
MKDKVLDREKRCNVLRHIRRHIKKSIWLFPKESSTYKLLTEMSDALKKHIRMLENTEEDKTNGNNER